MHVYSRQTIIAAIDVLNRNTTYTQAKISAFLIELGPDVYNAIPDEKNSALKRWNALKVFIDRNPNHQVLGESLESIIVDRAAALTPPLEKEHPWDSDPNPSTELMHFLRVLQKDGRTVSDGSIRTNFPIEFALPDVESNLIRLLVKHQFEIPKGHLDQTIENHSRGHWAAANSQMRSFLEGLFDAMAIRLDPTSEKGNSENRRDSLAKAGVFLIEMNEWGNNGKNFINGLLKRLHPHGAHPGLSDDDDSTFRLQVVLLTAHIILTRFDARTR